VKRVSKC